MEIKGIALRTALLGLGGLAGALLGDDPNCTVYNSVSSASGSPEYQNGCSTGAQCYGQSCRATNGYYDWAQNCFFTTSSGSQYLIVCNGGLS